MTNDLTHLTSAAFMSSVGKRTPIAARLSTVVHERGCAGLLPSPGLSWGASRAAAVAEGLGMHVTELACCLPRSPESLRDVRGFSVKFYTGTQLLYWAEI